MACQEEMYTISFRMKWTLHHKHVQEDKKEIIHLYWEIMNYRFMQFHCRLNDMFLHLKSASVYFLHKYFG